MFIVTWLFDKLGYMPKINMEVGVIHQAWPFPAVSEDFEPRPKKRVKKTRELLSKATTAKATTAKAAAKKTTRKPKAK